MIAGKIIPAIASTTACIAGIASMQIYSLLINDIAKNAYVNLGINTFLLTEPFKNKIHMDKYVGNILESRAIPRDWTVWDRIDINGPLSIKEFYEYILQKFSVKISKIIIEYKNVVEISEEK